MKSECLQRQVGKRVPILIETVIRPEYGNNHIGLGYTPDYYRVGLQQLPDANLQNEIREVDITSLNTTGEGLLAELN